MNRLDNEQSMQLANLLCHKLALDLDAGEVSTIDQTADLLQDLPTEVVLFAVRTQIQIDRCIHYHLDEHPKFSIILNKINTQT
jgi:hypothetical protein